MLAGPFAPRKMGEVRVRGAGENLGVDVFKLWRSVREGDDLSWADKCEVSRIEEEDNILPQVVFQGNIFEFKVDKGRGFELGSRHQRLKRHVGIVFVVLVGVEATDFWFHNYSVL